MLFKEFKNGSLKILPASCDENKLSNNCSNDLIDVHIKIDLFQFIISFQFSIKNIRFRGDDIAINNFKNNMCLRQKTNCCSSLNNYCDLSKTLKVNYENINKKSMFLLKSQTTSEIPRLLFINVSFLNFYGVKDEVGWRSLIISENALKTIHIENFTIVNFFFSHGLLYDINSGSFNNIIMVNIYIGNYCTIFDQIQNDNNSSYLTNGLFHFQNSSFLILNITNLTISSINILPLNPTQYAILFVSVSHSNLIINGLSFENNIDLSFCNFDSSLTIIIKDFTFRNLSNLKETSFFTLLNGSSAVLSNGLFSLISFSKSFFFYCQKDAELVLSAIQIEFFSGIFGSCSESTISIYDTKFENLKGNYFMIASKCILTMINFNSSSSLFSQAAFFISYVSNFIYTQSLCMNIDTPQFFLFQAKYLDVRAKIYFYSI